MATQKSQDKWKNKTWFNVFTPKVLGEGVIGEIPAGDPKGVEGRVIKVGLNWVTKNPAHGFLNVGLRVSGVDGNSARTELKYIENNPSYLHSFIRRYSTAVYTVDKTTDKDGKTLVLKMVIVAVGRIAESKRKGIRKAVSEFAKEHVSKIASDELVNEIVNGGFQAEGRKRMEDITEISKFELKRIEL